MKLNFTPQGVCCKAMNIEIEGGKVGAVEFIGGCHGNLQGIASLIKGMDKDDVIARLEGLDCRGRGTSCPDQLAKALKSIG